MARPKNDGKGRMGGRKKGTPNKSSLNVLMIIEAMKYSPFEVIIKDLTGKECTVRDRLEFNFRLLEYMYPKRRPIDDEGKSENTEHYIVEKLNGEKHVMC